MFVSTIVATIGRKSQNRVVKNALSQGLADGDYEVIVVKDHCRKVARTGDSVQTPETVAAILRGQTDTTANYGLATQQSIQSRNNILGNPGAFRRMWLSADTSNWQGCMIRAYLTCVVWDLQRRCLLRALGQFISSVYVTRNLFDFIAKVSNVLSLSLNEEGEWLPE